MVHDCNNSNFMPRDDFMKVFSQLEKVFSQLGYVSRLRNFNSIDNSEVYLYSNINYFEMK